MKETIEKTEPIPIAIDRYYERSPEDLLSRELAIWPRLHALSRVVISRSFKLQPLTEETKENLGALKEEPGFICPRHIDELDIPVIGTVIHKAGIEPAYYLAKAELLKSKSLARYLGHLGAVPVDRQNTNGPHLSRMAKYILEEKQRSIVGFPEGTRTSGDIVHKLEEGIPLLAVRNKRHVVPVGIYGTEGALKQLVRLRRPKVAVVAAEPIDAKGMRTHIVKEELHKRMQQTCDAAREIVVSAET